MVRKIREFEFNAVKDGKKFTIQQSEYTEENARKKIEAKEKGIKLGKLKRTLEYPHREGGSKV